MSFGSSTCSFLGHDLDFALGWDLGISVKVETKHRGPAVEPGLIPIQAYVGAWERAVRDLQSVGRRWEWAVPVEMRWLADRRYPAL